MTSKLVPVFSPKPADQERPTSLKGTLVKPRLIEDTTRVRDDGRVIEHAVSWMPSVVGEGLLSLDQVFSVWRLGPCEANSNECEWREAPCFAYVQRIL